MNKSESTRITFDIPLEKHKELKTLAAVSGKSMRVIFLEALECATSSHMPNEETRKVIKEAKQRKNLIKGKRAEEISKKLGL